MQKQTTFILATLALSVVTFGQNPITADSVYQIGYAANLNIGDSTVNLSNTGATSTVAFPNQNGNICANVYVFDPREEEIGCCACLITPDGLNSLSAQADLISDNLTPDVPTSIVIKLIASTATVAAGGTTATVCNPATVGPAPNNVTIGLAAWGSTLQRNGTPGNYSVVNAPFIPASLSLAELTRAVGLCNFIQSNGSGFGICRSCRLGALGGAKQ